MPETKRKPPTGEVTFLFTDIVGSTEAWEQHGDAYLPILQAHNAVLNDAIERYGGFLMKTEGDSFKIAFADPGAATQCATLAQAALQRYPWPHDIGAVRVRMSIHTGRPFMQGDDYFGPTLNRAARILSSAHGGQILLSEDTAERLQGKLDPGARLEDQGHHQLRDLSEPIRLYQLTHPRFAQRAFPPPRTMSGHAHNLPIQRRSFIGREKEIEQIAAVFASGDTQLLTVTGPAGSGKTRLSQQAAAEYVHLFPHGVWEVQLRNAVDVVGAAIEVADALGIAIPPGASPLETVRAYLADRRCLLILDDCGRVPQADRLIRELLSGSSHLRCLATSAQPLAVEGERALDLPALSVPPEDATPADVMASESGLLFVERVHEERADFHLTENRASKIAKLVRNIPRPGMIEKAAEFFRQHQGSIDALTQEVASKAGSVGQTAATRGRELLGRTKEVAAILLNQSAMLMENRELDEAEAKCREALEIYRRADDDRGVATTLRQLGNIAFAQRHFGRAVTLLTAAHECLHRLHDPEALAVRVDLEMAQRAAGNASQGSQGATDQALGPESAP